MDVWKDFIVIVCYIIKWVAWEGRDGPMGESLIQEVGIVYCSESACALLMYVLLLSLVPGFSHSLSLLLLELTSFRCDLLIGPAHSASPSTSPNLILATVR